MATDAAAPASSRTLPALGTYLHRLFDLGRRSIPVAIPALLFLWFYRFGMGLYGQVAGEGTSPLGFHDPRAQMGQILIAAAAYLPLLVLVYTPFLPLQDSLMRGERPSFLNAIRHVLERMVSFILSSFLQFLIIFVPVAFVIGILLAALAPLPGAARELAVLITVAAVTPLLLWIFLAAFFLVFAIPGVVLSGLGATRSISSSVRLVAGHFWGILGRLIVFFLMLLTIVLVLSIPSIILTVMATTAGRAGMALRVASTLWSSLLTALSFPFWVAALMVLYRALVPEGVASEAEPAPDPVAAHPAAGETPTPFLFE
ncbi:MAG: hypothetical protein ACM3PF_00575 [Bacteroidota bacterium]